MGPKVGYIPDAVVRIEWGLSEIIQAGDQHKVQALVNTLEDSQCDLDRHRITQDSYRTTFIQHGPLSPSESHCINMKNNQSLNNTGQARYNFSEKGLFGKYPKNIGQRGHNKFKRRQQKNPKASKRWFNCGSDGCSISTCMTEWWI